ncbi:CrpP-related protein [Achromobacter sp. ACM04]|uniref:CrpP-related protein n=1 Tax=Achromobacter sp. ACM04 TaxID=2769312 RepID=UPI002714A56F|nr:CrpP-related protein [Achromobacter sp. ACM04]
MRRDDIQELGAQAARDGLTLFDCPYFKAEEIPGHTGEELSSWKARVDAWAAGWKYARNVARPPLRFRKYILERKT